MTKSEDFAGHENLNSYTGHKGSTNHKNHKQKIKAIDKRLELKDKQMKKFHKIHHSSQSTYKQISIFEY